jgi:hypothetical protein
MTQEGQFEGIECIIRFVLEIDKLKEVLRKVKPIGKTRYENTSEHSWQIALIWPIPGSRIENLPRQSPKNGHELSLQNRP